MIFCNLSGHIRIDDWLGQFTTPILCQRQLQRLLYNKSFFSVPMLTSRRLLPWYPRGESELCCSRSASGYSHGLTGRYKPAIECVVPSSAPPAVEPTSSSCFLFRAFLQAVFYIIAPPYKGFNILLKLS